MAPQFSQFGQQEAVTFSTNHSIQHTNSQLVGAPTLLGGIGTDVGYGKSGPASLLASAQTRLLGHCSNLGVETVRKGQPRGLGATR
jgi:hypothetical protein